MGDVERVPAAVVARIAELDSDAVAEALDEAEWQRWVSSDARGYAFVARIVREVIERDQLNDGQRRQIRAAAART